MPSDSSPENDSTYPLLVKPEFVSQIPAPLLERASESDRYIMSQLSILSQCTKWSMDVLADVNHQTRRTNGRVTRAEADIASLQEVNTTKRVGWKTVLTIGGYLMAAVTFVYFIVGILSNSPAR